MLKTPQKIEIFWNPRNKNYFQGKGYVFTKIGEPFLVNIEDLQKTSHKEDIAICDYCKIEFKVSITNYTRSTKNNGKIACSKCRHKKTQETMVKRYGKAFSYQIEEFKSKGKQTCVEKYGEHFMQNEEIRCRVKETLIKNYGVYVPLKSEEIRQRFKDTCMSKYGVKHPMQIETFKEKRIKTFLEKYGVVNPMKLKEVVDKAKNTCIIRYGGESSQCDPEIRRKSVETLKKHGRIRVSSLEQKLFDMIISIFGKENCFQQYLFGSYTYDCLLNYNGIKIDIEYDGWYWYKDRIEQDKARDRYSILNNIKVLRYQSNGELPTKEQIIANIRYLADNEYSRLIVQMKDIQDEDIV